MANSRIDGFFEVVKGDEALRNELQATGCDEQFFLTAVRRGAERGFVFTANEMREGFPRQLGTELSEASLATVSGGLGGSYYQEVTKWFCCTCTWLGC